MKDANELFFEVAKRARELADMKMHDLRAEAYGCDTPYEAQQRNKYLTRGEILEEVLVEEFGNQFNWIHEHQE